MPIDALRGRSVERMFEFAGLVTEYMSAFGIKPVVVGGLAVELYTLNHYMTHAIDFISSGWADRTGSVCTFPFSQTLIVKYIQLSTPGKRLTPAKKAYFNEHFYKKTGKKSGINSKKRLRA